MASNIPPKTRLANIPPDNFTSNNPRLSLFWVGDDPDGYVVGFRYRWSFRINSSSAFDYKPWTTILNIGIDKNGTEKFALMTDADTATLPAVYKYFATLPPEGINADSANALDRGDTLLIEGRHVWASNPSTVRFPVHVNPNGGTFIFDSQDSLNPHTFEVAAIDNNGVLDPLEAKVTFQTPQVVPPHGEIIGFPSDTVLISDQITDTFTGIVFQFQGFDPNSRTIDYSWVIDKNEWPPNNIPWSPFSSSTTAKVTASNFVNPRDTTRVRHTIYLRTRNEFGSIDTLGYFIRFRVVGGQIVGQDTIPENHSFNAIYPKFLLNGYPKRTLFLNACFDYPDTLGPVYPGRAAIDNYYSSILNTIGKTGQYDILYVRRNPDYFPSLGVFAKYSSIYFCSDAISFEGFDARLLFNQQPMVDYCYMGGKMIISGWDIPFSFLAGQFMPLVPHTQNNSPRTGHHFTSASGEKSYPDAHLDLAKLDTSWYGTSSSHPPALEFIYTSRPSGFGEIIYRYNEDTCEAANFNGQDFCRPSQGSTVGVRYVGITYSVVYFGFPLYYIEKPTVTVMLQKAFQDIGE